MVKKKPNNGYFIFIAWVIGIIGLILAGYDLYNLVSDKGGITSNFLLGITLIYESLMINRGRIPKNP